MANVRASPKYSFGITSIRVPDPPGFRRTPSRISTDSRDSAPPHGGGGPVAWMGRRSAEDPPMWDPMQHARFKHRADRVRRVFPEGAMFAIAADAARELAESDIRSTLGMIWKESDQKCLWTLCVPTPWSSDVVRAFGCLLWTRHCIAM
jgi:hypothetical protein